VSEESEQNDQIVLTEDGLRQLAVALLEAIPNGDVSENLVRLATFNTNLLAGMLFGGSPTLQAALDGVDAYSNDVKALLQNNFEAAKEDMKNKSN
jgi:hypothetical protein